MTPARGTNDIIQELQKEVLSLQGYKKASGRQCLNTGLGPIEHAFPEKTFPVGAVHEFISNVPENAAATNGFIASLLGTLMQKGGGACLWISCKRTIFPPALKVFGIDPARIIFVDLMRQKDVLWAVEEALKCEALAAVVGELSELSFTESRRLQLAVEQSKVTGLIHRYNPKGKNTVACVTRWEIKSLTSINEGSMPGVSYPRWSIHLQKVRNGKPGSWMVEWAAGSFRHIPQTIPIPGIQTRKTG